MKRVKIIATGSYLPPKVLTNFDLEKIVDTSDEWIRERTGIRERHIVEGNKATSDLVIEASKETLRDAGLSPEALDTIIIATVTQDTIYPSTACWVQKGLGIRGIAAFDINAACSGFLYGLEVAAGLISTGASKVVLLAGAETMSKAVNWDDKNTCVLFGDGAGTCIISRTDEDCGIISSFWAADGVLGELLIQPAGGSRMPPSHETVDKKLHSVRMEGREVFKHAIMKMSEAIKEVFKESGLTPDDIDLYIPHQANLRIIEATCRRVNFPLERTYITIHKYANVPAATIPISLHDAVKEGRIHRGDKILFSSFGGGFTWGAMIFKW